MHDRVAGPQLQLARDRGAGPGLMAIHDLPLRRTLTAQVALFWKQAQKAVLHLLLSVGCNKSTFALASDQQIFSGQFVDRFAHRPLADFIAGCEFGLAGNGSAGFPLACLQALGNQQFNLLVQRTERGGAADRRGGDARLRRSPATGGFWSAGCRWFHSGVIITDGLFSYIRHKTAVIEPKPC